MQGCPNHGHEHDAGDHSDKGIFGRFKSGKHAVIVIQPSRDGKSEIAHERVPITKEPRSHAGRERGRETDGFATNRGESVQRRDLRTNPPRRLADLFQADHFGPKKDSQYNDQR